MTLLVNLDVDDLKKAIDFYERAIGLRTKRLLVDGRDEPSAGARG
jgi:catechol 2,3-dioxygenase-like lactoylglutathione lyase family enzyme